MTSFYRVSDRNIAIWGEADSVAKTYTLPWGAGVAGSLPWALPAFPSLLIFSVAWTLTTNAVAVGRRPYLRLTQPGGAGVTVWPAITTTIGAQTRRYEFCSGFSMVTTLAGTRIREPLPEDLILLGGVNGDSGVFDISILNVQAGDQYATNVSILGRLLY